MRDEYIQNSQKQNNKIKKYGKSLIKVAIGLTVASLGLTIPGAPIVDFISKLSIFNSETSVLIGILTKSLMMAGGVAGAIVNGIKARKAKIAIKNLKDEEKEIFESIENENSNIKTRNNYLEKELAKVNQKELKTLNEKTSLLDNDLSKENVFEDKELTLKKTR